MKKEKLLKQLEQTQKLLKQFDKVKKEQESIIYKSLDALNVEQKEDIVYFKAKINQILQKSKKGDVSYMEHLNELKAKFANMYPPKKP